MDYGEKFFIFSKRAGKNLRVFAYLDKEDKNSNQGIKTRSRE
jgi:hypothetical protein